MAANLVSSVILAIIIAGCGSVDLKVGRKERVRPEFIPASVDEIKTIPLTTQSFQDFINSFENELEENGAKLVYQLKEGLRNKLRNVLGQIEDSVFINATTPVAVTTPLMSRLLDSGKTELRSSDFDFFDEAKVFEQAFVGLLGVSIKNKVDQLPDPDKLPSIDLLTTVLFFDLGINIKGAGSLADTVTGRQFSSQLEWQLVPEVEGEILKKSRITFEFSNQLGQRYLSMNYFVNSLTDSKIACLRLVLASADDSMGLSIKYGLVDEASQWTHLNIDRSLHLKVLKNRKLEWKELFLNASGIEEEHMATIDLETLIAELK